MTVDGIPLGGIQLESVGIVGLVLLLLLGFATGRLYTRSQVVEMQGRHTAEIDRLVKAHERELADATHERGEWRTEARLSQQTVIELNEQNRDLLNAFGPMLTDFFEKLRQLATHLRGERNQT